MLMLISNYYFHWNLPTIKEEIKKNIYQTFLCILQSLVQRIKMYVLEWKWRRMKTIKTIFKTEEKMSCAEKLNFKNLNTKLHCYAFKRWLINQSIIYWFSSSLR